MPGTSDSCRIKTKAEPGRLLPRQKGADMTAEGYRAELELQYSVTELEAEQESGG